VPSAPGRTRVEIVAPLFNGERFLDAFLSSLHAQTHADWRLWLRDDGSTDGTVAIARAAAATDPRIQLLPSDGQRLGASGGFGWLLEHVPPESRYVMCADQDDVWLPHKIARTLAAMTAAEAAARGPVLIHTDLTVVDEALHVVHSSFWQYAGVDPEPVSLRRLIVENVATGATVMLNRELRDLAGPLPAEAVYHDWWLACVAGAFGRLVPVRESTVLYRQHDANVVGAPRSARPRWYHLPAVAWTAMHRTAHLRAEVARTARQARVFLDRFGPRLTDDNRRFLAAYAALPDQRFLRRKVGLVRLRLRPEHGVWRNLGVLLRA
jgi:Glycosyltransferases involved in cell wall biogenesis